MKAQQIKFTIEWPSTPGAKLAPQAGAKTLREARKIAKEETHHRKDLKGFGVRIYKGDKFVEYAGPPR